MFVKFCGFTREDDVTAAMSLPISAAGFVFFSGSLRYVSPLRAQRLSHIAGAGTAARVGVFAGLDPDSIREVAESVGLDYLQVYEQPVIDELEGYRPLIICHRIGSVEDLMRIGEPRGEDLLLLDSKVDGCLGGTGRRFNWEYLREFPFLDRTIIAGGINESNAAELLETVRPFGIDLSSGIETSPGVKSAEKMSRIMRIINEVIRNETASR